MPRMIFSRLIGAGLLVVAVLVAAAMSSASAAPVEAARKCSANYRLGSTYVTSLSTRGVSCRKGKRVVAAFHECRKRKGARGRCASAAGYSCSEGRRTGIRTQYDSRATCKRGAKRVSHSYTQNT
jgi:hypothetical protein